MKVLLISPPLKKGGAGPPLGLGYLASSLEQNGHDVRIIDSLAMNYSLKDIKKEFKFFDPDVVGLSCITQFIYKSYFIAKMVKKNNPNCLVVLGGPHPSVLPRETLEECPVIDVIVIGEGEKTIVDLLEKYEKQDKNGFFEVKGISFRLNGKIIENQCRELIEDLDSIPFPAYHLLPMEKYSYKVKSSNYNLDTKYSEPFSYMISSRGCPYNCIFCSTSSIFGRNVRMRSPSNVIEELRQIVDRYNIKSLMFMDDTFTLQKKRVVEICNLIIKEKIDVYWHCITRVEHFDREMAKIMKKSGCNRISFGFESGVQQTLDYLCKGFTLQDSKRSAKIANDEKIQVLGSFIIGAPGETKPMIERTIQFADDLNLFFAGFCLLTPYPGTQIYFYAKNNNILLTKKWSKYSYDKPIIKIEGISNRELKKFLKEANSRFINRDYTSGTKYK